MSKTIKVNNDCVPISPDKINSSDNWLFDYKKYKKQHKKIQKIKERIKKKRNDKKDFDI